ncbi:CheY-like chemotaxis protein [Methanohalophilus levihalophilus]|uniref:response regulator transcription factor n=1 Tax=Methanohalophilus levihalophilus TaxID=1431282 RepID=UPI001AE8E56C|nr:response regulator [Methanohalophilus levihalophilus]MBP2030252.1 CheY-like chemotaxis protein [Methanohalophilus levihalophilus]
MPGEQTEEILATLRRELEGKNVLLFAPANVFSERIIHFYTSSVLENIDDKKIIWLCLKDPREKVLSRFSEYGLDVESFLDRMWFIDVEKPGVEPAKNTLYCSSQTDYIKIGSYVGKLFTDYPDSLLIIDDLNVLSKDSLQVVENFGKFLTRSAREHSGSIISMLNVGGSSEVENAMKSFFDVIINIDEAGEMHTEIGLKTLDFRYSVDKGEIELEYIQKKVKKDRLKILVVDDEPDIPDLIKLSLATEPYDFLVAYSGKEAVETATKELPDLLLLDIMMPDMDGYEVVEKLKTVRETSDIAIIMVSAKTNVEDKLKGMELGIDDYISKPFDKREINARIKMVMKRFGWNPPETSE